MRERIKDKGRLEHILAAIDLIENNKHRFTLEQVEADPIMFFGFVKQIEIIGEAVYMLSKEFRAAHPDVEWDDIEGMRHVLVHGYYTIKPKRVWSVVTNDIPTLRTAIVRLLQEETSSDQNQ